MNKIIHGDALAELEKLESGSIDLLVTDPPYGIGFMGKDWDSFNEIVNPQGAYANKKGFKKLPRQKTKSMQEFFVPIWEECLRVLKDGAFAFVMCSPRADVMAKQINALQDAGFMVSFTPIFWAYASGFPKAQNIAKHISKAIDNIKQKMYNSNIWNTNLNNVKSAGQSYLNSLIEAGLLTTSSDFVADNVVQFFRTKNINASASIVEGNLSEVQHLSGANIFTVPENVVTLPKQKLSNVHIVELNLDDQNQRMSIRIIFVPVNVQAFICERVENKIREGVVQKIGNGKPKSWNETDINALCVEIIHDLKFITRWQLWNTLTEDMKSQMVSHFATNVIITKSIRECLLIKTASILGKNPHHRNTLGGIGDGHYEGIWSQNKRQIHTGEGDITAPATPQAKALDGSYGGFQPKPAVEVIIVAMKPLSEKTYVDQALKNRKGITWLDDGRIPYESEDDKQILEDKASKEFTGVKPFGGVDGKGSALLPNNQGRFPANLICEDDVLNDGRILKVGGRGDGIDSVDKHHTLGGGQHNTDYADSGSFSRYFDLDKWFEERIKQLPASVQKTFPFLIIPKASKSEKNKGCEDLPNSELFTKGHGNQETDDVTQRFRTITKNNHPTVKPIKLMSYLIVLGSREGDIVLDPFLGSGTTALVCQLLNRECIGIEINKDYYDIAIKRCSQKTLV